MYGCSSFFFLKEKRGGAWLVRLGRLLQAEKGLWGWWGGREAAGGPFPPSFSLRPQSAQRSFRGGGRLRV